MIRIATTSTHVLATRCGGKTLTAPETQIQKQEQALDEALQLTFPASDPVAVTATKTKE